MDLSVIICTHNRASSLKHTLEELRRQEVPGNLPWELLIVDNNSHDSTREVVANFARQTHVPCIYVWEPRQGLSCARNTGIENAKGAIIAFTDDDVSPAEGWIRSIVDVMRQRAADGVGGRILPQWPFLPPGWLVQDPTLLAHLALIDSEQCRRIESGKSAQIFGANMAFRRELFQELGTFDVGLGRVGSKLYSHDEKEFVDRAVAAGKLIIYEPRIQVWHRIAPERLQKRYFRKWSLDDGEKRAMRFESSKHFKPFGIPARVWARILRDLFRWFWSLLRGSPKSFRRETKLWFHVGFIRGTRQRGVSA